MRIRPELEHTDDAAVVQAVDIWIAPSCKICLMKYTVVSATTDPKADENLIFWHSVKCEAVET